MRLTALVLAGVSVATLSACATIPENGRPAALSADAARIVSDTPAPEGQKMSLDQALDDHGKVVIVDEKTGEKKLICKRIVTTGTRFGTKVCATPKEWAARRQESQDRLDDVQRNMDARCAAAGC